MLLIPRIVLATKRLHFATRRGAALVMDFAELTRVSASILHLIVIWPIPQDSCSYASCEYCCINTGYTVECGSQAYCVTWLIVGITLWFLITVAVVYLIIKKKRETVMRMLMVETMAEKAHQEDLQAKVSKERAEKQVIAAPF